ncbi:MAG: hypothetical protein LBU98_00855, partial [Alistipes sp.]|nr:hypothetical protein [Alistipes sp.]
MATQMHPAVSSSQQPTRGSEPPTHAVEHAARYGRLYKQKFFGCHLARDLRSPAGYFVLHRRVHQHWISQLSPHKKLSRYFVKVPELVYRHIIQSFVSSDFV